LVVVAKEEDGVETVDGPEVQEAMGTFDADPGLLSMETLDVWQACTAPSASVGVSPVVGQTGFKLFDLNVGSGDPLEFGVDDRLGHAAGEGVQAHTLNVMGFVAEDGLVQDLTAEGSPARTVLGEADVRLNKDSRGLMGSRNHSRGILRLAVLLKKSLLCPPPRRGKPSLSKKDGTAGSVSIAADRRGAKLGQSGTSGLSVEDRATSLLLRASDPSGSDAQRSEADKQQFHGQFAASLQSEMLGDMRHVLGIPVGVTGGLEVLATDADD
jgi:hypothetical protein